MTSFNILDIQLLNKKKYIVLFSGLEFSPIENIVNELSKDFNAIILNFLHLELDDSLDVINNRINDLLNKKSQAIFIIAKTFPSNKIKIPIDLHINISLNKNFILNLDPLKRENLPDLYIKSLKENRINKYINLKKDYDLNEIIDEIFYFIIDDLEKKIYGDKYNILSHKFYNNTSSEKSENSKLVFNPKSLSRDEKNKIATENAEKEIQDSIDNDEDDNTLDTDLEDLDDILENEVRIFGSR